MYSGPLKMPGVWQGAICLSHYSQQKRQPQDKMSREMRHMGEPWILSRVPISKESGRQEMKKYSQY